MADEAHKVIQKTEIITKVKTKEEEIIIFIVRNDINRSTRELYVNTPLKSACAYIELDKFKAKKDNEGLYSDGKCVCTVYT